MTDIQGGYFDRLLLTPIKRLALLLGLMIADLVLVMALTIPVLVLGFATGVRFETGVLGVLAFILIAGLWGLVFTGFPYAIALKTGNPGAVSASFILFFPFAFLTTSFLPKDSLSGWLAAVASVNPVTYLLDGLRSLITDGWDFGKLAIALLAVAGVGVVSMGLAFAAPARTGEAGLSPRSTLPPVSGSSGGSGSTCSPRCRRSRHDVARWGTCCCPSCRSCSAAR